MNKSPRRMASMLAAPFMIEKAMHMPEGHIIVGASWDFDSQSIILYLEGPGLPEVPLGAPVPRITPTVTETQDERGGITATAWEWNIA